MDSSNMQQNASSTSLKKTRVKSPQTQIAVIRLNRGEEKGPKGYGAKTLRLHRRRWKTGVWGNFLLGWLLA
jgi:hypothetical protein